MSEFRKSPLPVSRPRRPEVVFTPRSRTGLMRGADQLANVLRPTLGPIPRLVALARYAPGDPPELLDDGATIARRIIQLPNRDEDMGAMLLRHILWRMHETVGDGTVTTAVLFQAGVQESYRYVAAGFNPMRIRHGLQQAVDIAIDHLRKMARPLEGEEAISRVAQALCQDEELASLLGEIFDIVGSDGYVQVEAGQKRVLEREYVEGGYWKNGWLSARFMTDPESQVVELAEPAILISDIEINTASQLVPILEKVVRAGFKSFLVIGRDVKDSALGLLIHNANRKVISTLAVRAPGFGPERKPILRDIAALTGGTPLDEQVGASIERAELTDLGRARRAWANKSRFGLAGGHGDPILLRKHIAEVRTALAGEEDPFEQDRLRRRLGMLLGGVAVLRVGASTKSEVEFCKARAERTVVAVRSALQGGVVPGGGSAYLACQAAVRNAVQQVSDDAVRAGFALLERALEEPLRAIATNGGYAPSTVVARVGASTDGIGFDARTGQLCDLWTTGILDAEHTLETALQVAMSGVAMVLTTDVLVHRRKPPETELEP
jgi:chaperonin GroEL